MDTYLNYTQTERNVNDADILEHRTCERTTKCIRTEHSQLSFYPD
jgi:hypothetical protein